jgi:hypothetical protein
MDPEIKALLILMREYIIEHEMQMGECVAWNKLKRMAGIGADRRSDLEWLVAHDPTTPYPYRPERLDMPGAITS